MTETPTFFEKLTRLIGAIAIMLLGIGILILIGIACTADVRAQTPLDAPGGPVCVYRAETIINRHPLHRSVIVQGRAYGYLQQVDAVPYIRSVFGLNEMFFHHELASAVVQYSIAGSPVLGSIRLAAWNDDAPNMTLGSLVRSYMLTGNPQQRAFYGMWLVRVVNSSFNDSCNGGTQ